MISLMPLPYGADALEPHIGSETIETHHGKHHAGYVKKTNAAIAGIPLADAALETIIQTAADEKDQKLFNQAAQVWNHGFYWHSLSPEARQARCGARRGNRARSRIGRSTADRLVGTSRILVLAGCGSPCVMGRLLSKQRMTLPLWQPAQPCRCW